MFWEGSEGSEVESNEFLEGFPSNHSATGSRMFGSLLTLLRMVGSVESNGFLEWLEGLECLEGDESNAP